MEAATPMTMAMSMSIPSPSPLYSYHSLSFPSASIHRYRSRTKLGKKTGFGFGFGFPITMVKVKASSDSNSNSTSSDSNAIAPLELQSPIGQFLSQILTTHPHLLPAAVDQQLQLLQQQAQQHPSSSSSSTDLVLYRRIAEVQENDRRTSLEEILYAMVVQRFMDANVSLTPSITPSSSSTTNIWPPQQQQQQQQDDDEKLERLHSSEANEMIQNHLSLVLGNRNRIGDYASVAKISKLRVGQVYAASLMYGYFLKRVDERFQLEKTVKVLSNATEEEEEEGESHFLHPEVEISSSSMPGEGDGGFKTGIKPSRLRTYVMSLDGETLQRLTTIRSKEAVNIIEKHTEALFGRPSPDIVIDSDTSKERDQLINITFGGLKRLVLEAVSFGSFLWDVETYVDSRYHFVTN